MIDLYTHNTPNGQKPVICLEECELPYTLHDVDIGRGEQRSDGFLRISPNGKIPAITDTDADQDGPLHVFESGAILIHLAEKARSPLLPAAPRARLQTLQWLFWQVGGVGPMFGQAGFFTTFGGVDVPFASKRYTDESLRLLGVLDRKLSQTAFLAGETYTLADIATWPWVSGAGRIGIDLTPFAHVRRWVDRVGARPAVQRALSALAGPGA